MPDTALPPSSDPTSASPQPERSARRIRPQEPEVERSAELLRLALPLISRHGRGFAPISYAIWYEYVRGENSGLKAELDEAIRVHQRIPEHFTFDVYQRHVVDKLEDMVNKGRAGLLDLLNEVNDSVDSTAATAQAFDDRLADFDRAIDENMPASSLRDQIGNLRGDVHLMNDSMRDLRQRLDASREEVARLADELVQAREEAQVDPLTGLMNRRGFNLMLSSLADTALNDGQPLALVLIDIDHFKKVNDEHGHLFGDKVIQGVAKILHGGVMRKDCVARYGGEEFALILPQTDLAGGKAVAERIRQAVAMSRIRRANSDEVISNITVSAGVALLKDADPTLLIDAADQALYEAKHEGRNRVAIAR